MASAILGAVLSAVATGYANYKLSEKQRERAVQDRDYANEYNLPVNQVQRLKDAGINPNSVAMGNSGVVQGNESVGINPYTTPDLKDPLGVASNSFLSFMQGKTENSLRDVRVAEAQANISNLESSAKKLGVDTQYQSILNRYAAALQENAIRESKGRQAESWANVGVLNSQTKKYAYELQNILPEELKKIISERNVNVLRLDEMLATIEEHYSNVELNKSKTEESQAQASLIESQKEGQDIENANAQEIANQVISHYKAMVTNLGSATAKNEEETFWMLFDYMDKNSLSILGNKIPIARFGQSDYKSHIGQKIVERYGIKP